MSYSSTRAAATSSCVESGLEAQRTTSAPAAFNVRARFAVSVVTCRQAETRWPASGCSRSKRSRIAASTGICRSAHSMRRFPSGVSARSFTSCLIVVAILPLYLRLRGEQALVLALLPFDPVGLGRALCGDGRPLEPLLDRGPEFRPAPHPDHERDVVELHGEGAPQLLETTQQRELVLAVAPVARRGPLGHDEAGRLEVPQHPGGPPRPRRRLADAVRLQGAKPYHNYVKVGGRVARRTLPVCAST